MRLNFLLLNVMKMQKGGYINESACDFLFFKHTRLSGANT